VVNATANNSFNTIKVGNGNDTIHVGFDDDVTVGKGHDTFVFDGTTLGSIGRVDIFNFDSSKDVIDLSSKFATQVSVQKGSFGTGILIDNGNAGDGILLVGVHVSAVHINFV
jgi:hypothetical protein